MSVSRARLVLSVCNESFRVHLIYDRNTIRYPFKAKCVALASHAAAVIEPVAGAHLLSTPCIRRRNTGTARGYAVGASFLIDGGVIAERWWGRYCRWHGLRPGSDHWRRPAATTAKASSGTRSRDPREHAAVRLVGAARHRVDIVKAIGQRT